MKDKFWEYFDDESRAYVATIMDAEADYYEKAKNCINPHLKSGGGVVLDIGNGGIINYEYSELKKLVCADISVSDKIQQAYKNVPNIEFVETNILDMAIFEDGSFDNVVVQKVIHHLAEDSYKKTRINCMRAMRECIRVLKPGGTLIICESTVSRWFECLEIIFFKLMLKCCDLVKFDRVYQYSPKSLEKLLTKELSDIATLETVSDIGTGQHVLFLGRKFPARLLPCSVTFYLAKKNR